VVCAHGSAAPAAQRVVTDLVDAAAARMPGVRVVAAYADVQDPRVGEVVASAIAPHARIVVVPLLLGAGYHVEVDIAASVAPFPGQAIGTAPVGPDPLLAEILLARLTDAGARPGDAVIVAAVGSSRAAGIAGVEQSRDDLAARWPGPVTIGYGAAGKPTVVEAVAAARAAGAARVAVAPYMLGPGLFHTRLARAGADLVAAPLGADLRIVDLITARFAEGLATLGVHRGARP